MSDAKYRDYLLGKLPESEAQAFETRLLADEALFADVRTAENDLFDGFASGELDPDTRAVFLKRYGHKKRRMRFARAFSQRVPAGNIVAFHARPRWLYAVAAALAIAIVGAYFVRSDRPSPSRAPIARTETLIISTVTVTLATSRDGEARTAVDIPINAAGLQIRVRLDPEDKFDRYALIVRDAKGAEVLHAQNLVAQTQNGDLVVSAQAPPLQAGTYRIAVEGGSTPLGFTTLEVHR